MLGDTCGSCVAVNAFAFLLLYVADSTAVIAAVPAEVHAAIAALLVFAGVVCGIPVVSSHGFTATACAAGFWAAATGPTAAGVAMLSRGALGMTAAWYVSAWCAPKTQLWLGLTHVLAFAAVAAAAQTPEGKRIIAMAQAYAPQAPTLVKAAKPQSWWVK